MPEQDPYKQLGVPQDASPDEIEDAYDALYDKYEPPARAGSKESAEVLHKLNEARETLLDPDRRAQLDNRLQSRQESAQIPAPPSSASIDATADTSLPTAAVRTRRRSANRPRYVEPAPRRRMLPLAAAGLLLLVFLALGAVFLLLQPRNTGAPLGVPPASGDRGEVMASVNGLPIYSDDWQVRLERDKNTALADPLFTPSFNNFQGITGTLMLNVYKADALDKLINMEVIQQQAKKEGLYPNPTQQEQLLADAKAQDLKGGKSFEQFLNEKHITADHYNRTIIENIVYSVVANEHLPKKGTAEARTEGFIKWICDARQGYDVKVYKDFQAANNQPCTSGLPSDLPLPGLDEQVPPEDVPTAPAPFKPGTQSTPATP